jgi:hypothetical protein
VVYTPFKYTEEIPYLVVALEHEGRSQYFRALVDSGCTRTHISWEIAEFFNIDLSDAGDSETVGLDEKHVVKGKMGKIKMQISGVGEQFESPAIFSKDLPVDILLGQDNFFELFNIRFEKWQGKFFIESVSEIV